MKNQLKFLSLFFSLATLWSSSEAAEQKKPVKVFILAGQSNMQGKAAAKEEFQGNVLLAGTAQYWPASQKIMEGKWEVFRAAAKVNSDKAKDDASRLDPGEYYRINWEEKYQKGLSFTSDKRYHYLGSAACYYQMGESMGKAMVGLVKGK